MGKNTIKKIFITSAALLGMSVMSFDDATAQTFKDLAAKQEQKAEQQVQFNLTHAEKLAGLAAANLHGTVTIPEYEKTIQTPEALKRYENISVNQQMAELLTAKTTADFSGYNQFDMLKSFTPVSNLEFLNFDAGEKVLIDNFNHLSKESLIELSLITGKDYRNYSITKNDIPLEHYYLFQKIQEAKANLLERNMKSQEMQRLAEMILFSTYINLSMFPEDVMTYGAQINPQLKERFEDVVGLSFEEIQEMTATSSIGYDLNINDYVYIANYTPDEDDNMLRM